MLTVHECVSAREVREFFALSARFSYLPAEAGFLKRFAHPAVDPRRACGPMAYLLARRDGQASGRILTFRDEGYIAHVGRNTGFFALLDAEDSVTAQALLREAVKRQGKWGSGELLGPVSPNGGDCFQGLAEKGKTALFSGRVSTAAMAALCAEGFQEAGGWLSYELMVPRENVLAELARRAEMRFGLRVVSFEGLGGMTRLARAVREVSRPDEGEGMLRELDHLSPLIVRRHCFAAQKDGRAMGYLLALGARGARLRFASLQTAEDACRPAVAALLLSAACDSLLPAGVKTVNVSTIDADNAPSFRLAERFTIAEKCKFSRFTRKVPII